jgi:hypothetical protein
VVPDRALGLAEDVSDLSGGVSRFEEQRDLLLLRTERLEELRLRVVLRDERAGVASRCCGGREDLDRFHAPCLGRLPAEVAGDGVP